MRLQSYCGLRAQKLTSTKGSWHAKEVLALLERILRESRASGSRHAMYQLETQHSASITKGKAKAKEHKMAGVRCTLLPRALDTRTEAHTLT